MKEKLKNRFCWRRKNLVGVRLRKKEKLKEVEIDLFFNFFFKEIFILVEKIMLIDKLGKI